MQKYEVRYSMQDSLREEFKKTDLPVPQWECHQLEGARRAPLEEVLVRP